MTPTLSPLASLVDLVASGDLDETHALAILTKRNLNADPSALADAVTATTTLRDLADGTADPVLLTDGAATSPRIDRRAMAVEQAQDALETALRGLLRAEVRVA